MLKTQGVTKDHYSLCMHVKTKQNTQLFPPETQPLYQCAWYNMAPLRKICFSHWKFSCSIFAFRSSQF